MNTGEIEIDKIEQGQTSTKKFGWGKMPKKSESIGRDHFYFFQI